MPIRFHPDLDHALRSLASDIIRAVMAAADPADALTKHFDQSRFTRPTHILSLGKASIPMTNASIDLLGDRFARATVLAPHALCAQTAFKDHSVELLGTDHPLPTACNIDATKQLIAHACSIPDDHQVLVLISGGGSAMLCAPNPGVTLEHIAQTTSTLLHAGAPIAEINAARSKLETIKAGGLAHQLDHVARRDVYLLSDVIGDDLSIIASGPMYDPSDLCASLSIPHTIIGSNQTAIDALLAWAAHDHIEVLHTHRQAIGSPTHLAKDLAHQLTQHPSTNAPLALCLGGEPTVNTGTNNSGSNSGIGGPMLELALACANELASAPFRWTVLTFATDGIDGPTDAAGAIITDDMLCQADTIKHIQRALNDHDSLSMCDDLHATIRTGHTATNVNDIAIVIRFPDESNRSTYAQ